MQVVDDSSCGMQLSGQTGTSQGGRCQEALGAVGRWQKVELIVSFSLSRCPTLATLSMNFWRVQLDCRRSYV